MKKYFLLFFILLQTSVFSQELNLIEKKLNNLIDKKIYWSSNKDNKNASDSLTKCNEDFERFVLDFTSKNPKTLTYSFNKVKNRLNIISSDDGLFRIYTWNTYEGGTMQFYRNVLQYKVDGKVYSQINNNDPEDNDCSFYDMNEVIVKNKHFYVTSSIRVASSANYYYEAKIFSIENHQLNKNAKLIKTKSGIKNTLGYEVDLSNSSNRDRKDGLDERKYMDLIYDKKNKTIIIPLIEGDGKVTKKKIKYKFNGKYFEKI